MHRRGLAHAAALLLATLAIAACAEEAPPAPAEPVARELTLAYDSALDAPLSEILTAWPPDRPRVRFEPDTSTSITLSAAADRTPPDVIVITAQTPHPDGRHSPISTRPWIADPILFVSRADDDRTTDTLLIDEATRVAIAHESDPLGQYTRFGLRKRNRWELVKDRALRYSGPNELLDAVETGAADIAAVYSSQLAPRLAADPPALAPREELTVTDSSRRAFVVIVMTPDGIDLARWLTSSEQTAAAAPFGYHPDSAETP